MSIVYKKHNLFPDSILVREFNGTVSAVEIIKSWKHMIKDRSLSDSTKGIVNNIVNCKLQIDFESFEMLMSFLKGHKRLRKIKIAVVCNDSINIVFPTIGEKTVPELKIKPFSSNEAAVDWIIFG